MEKIEISAKSIDKAIEEGLQKLGVSLDQVEINILSEGGLFKKAKIEMVLISAEKTAKKETKPSKEKGVEFTEKELEFMGEKASFDEKEEKAVKEVKAEKSGKAEAKSEKKEKADKKVEKKEDKKEEKKITPTKNVIVENKNIVKQETISENKPEKTEYEIKPIKNREERQRERVEMSDEDRKTLEDAVKVAGKEFLDGFIKTLEIEATLSINQVEDNIEFAIDGSNLGSLIGYRGSSLEALQYLLNVVIGNKTAYKQRVFLNIENYRQKREETLKAMADRIAGKVLESQRRCKLEPMSSFERRVIHTYLSERQHIVTRSEGIEPNRYLIIEYAE